MGVGLAPLLGLGVSWWLSENRCRGLRFFKRYLFPSAVTVKVLVAGTLAGWWLGQTDLGAALPRGLAVGTVVSSLLAVGLAFDRRGPQPMRGDAGFWLVCLSVCALVLGSAISAPAVWQFAPMERLAGFLPYSDAAAYYQQVLEWPAPTFNPINSRRPLSTALNILAFDLGGATLLGLLGVHAALAALGITAFMAALARVAGRPAAMAAGFALLMWTWPYAGIPLSEINSITLSAAGYAVLLLALAQRDRGVAVVGLLALVLAYAIRPYNPLMPALMAFAVSLGLAKPWRRALLGALATAVGASLVGVVLSAALSFVYGHPAGSANANAAYTALGLARGTDWKEASNWLEAQHPGLSERAASSLMYHAAVVAIRQDPRPLFKALGVGLVKACYFTQQALGATLGFRPQPVGEAQRGGREFLRFVVAHPTIWLTMMWTVISVWALFRVQKKCPPVAILAGVSVLGLFSAAPVFFGDGSWRAVASLYPGLALLVAAIPLAMLAARPAPEVVSHQPTRALNAWHAPVNLLAVPLALLGFAGLAMLYPASFRYVNDPARPWAESLVLEIRQDTTPHWIGLNRAAVAPSDLQAWATTMGHAAWATFIARHSAALIEVRYEHGGYSLVVQDAAGLSKAADVPQDSLFKLRSASSLED